MDSSFNPMHWLAEPVSAVPDAAGFPDWHALRGRLIAARATLHAIGGDAAATPDGPSGSLAGSFDPGCARVLSQIGHGSVQINQSRIGDGKAVSDNPDPVAGTPTTGGRG